MIGEADALDIVLRLGLAILFGGLLGFERELQDKPAGLRTHMMVCLGSATFTLVAAQLFEQILASPHDVIQLDPSRIIEGIIGGIGFLGAGSIIQARGSVEGLTTAGSLWLVGAVGVAVGGAHYVLAGVAVGLGLLVLYVVGLIERRLRPKARERQD